MDSSFFIAKKLAFSGDKSFTRVIVSIAIAGLAISTAVMILSSAIITGFKKEINAKIFGFWGHIHVSDSGITRNFELRPIDISQPYFQKLMVLGQVEYFEPVRIFGFPLENYQRQRFTKGGVKTVNPYIIMPCLLETKKDMMAGLFKGVGKNYDWSAMQRFMTEGRGLGVEAPANGIVISRIIARKLKINSGDKIIVSFVKEQVKLRRVLEVTGIYNTGLEEYDERFILGDANLLQEILNWLPTEYSGIEIFANHFADAQVLNDYIYTQILPSNIYSETISEKFPNIFEWLKLQDINERIILQLMGIVAIINLVTVLLILILERTRMVGIMKSLGADNWMVRRIFLYHASYILIWGLVIGNLLGLGIAWVQKSTGIIKLDENNYYLDVAPIHIDWMQIGIINMLAFLACVLTLIIPSLVIKKITPVSALRFD
ncbi:MAG: ABC transporter permease [Saprospiraceae bacterium]|nr:ABC transporter permease [Saprospiraceae bacterium]